MYIPPPSSFSAGPKDFIKEEWAGSYFQLEIAHAPGFSVLKRIWGFESIPFLISTNYTFKQDSSMGPLFLLPIRE